MKIIILLVFLIISTFAQATVSPPPSISDAELKKFEQWKEHWSKNKTIQGHSTESNLTYLNELIYSSSPYLQQHAFNPVNWKSWSQGLLKETQESGQLIFLSIGYSTCHWCHMMEKESFNDPSVAELVNKNYIAVKVDREELPHVDEYYKAALEQVKGSAGWPITAIITGEGKPVFIDSYLSNNKLKSLLQRVAAVWKQQPEFLTASAESVDELLKERFNTRSKTKMPEGFLSTINEKLIAQLDPVNGGFEGEAKFPSEASLFYMLDQVNRGPHPELEKLLELQLDRMISGGLYDHVEGGFHRYSTDQSWTVPHYEKMLYNQAQLISVYVRAYEYFRKPEYKVVISETVQNLLENFYLEGEGFLTAIDADFKDEEGGYYLYSPKEISDIKNKSIRTYAVPETKKVGVMLDRNNSVSDRDIETAIKSLRDLRVNKGTPHKDKKIITGLNGLAISSLIDASKILNDENLVSIASQVAESLYKQRYDIKSRKLSRLPNQVPAEVLYLDDYVYFSDALIKLYDATQEQNWLDMSHSIVNRAIQLFIGSGGQVLTSEGGASGVSLNNAQDSELVSPVAMLARTIFKLDKRSGENRLSKNYSNVRAYLQSRITQEPVNHLFAVFVENEIENGTTESKRYFASSKGVIKFECTELTGSQCKKMEINIELKDGWHINSNEPLQDYLIATKVDVPVGIHVKYPQPNKVKLGFQQHPLSLYEGRVRIELEKTGNSNITQMLSVPLQACNDNICLMPEQNSFIF